jgi:hypothetical protein
MTPPDELEALSVERSQGGAQRQSAGQIKDYDLHPSVYSR